MPSLANTISNTDFKDEFKHIADYMTLAFTGESETAIRTAMDNLLSTMLSDMGNNQYITLNEYSTSNEKCPALVQRAGKGNCFLAWY